MTAEYGSEFESDSAADRVTVTLYAKWTPNEYTIVYDANGGEGSMENSAASYGSDVTLRENTFTKDGAGFVGWSTAADSSGTSYADTAYIRIPDNIPTRSEALFLGWSTEKDGDVVYRPGDEVPVANANTTLYAVWQKSYQYTLSYDLNYEGAGVTTTLPYSNTVSYIEVNIISSDAAREGYTFLGWAETPDATEAAYSYPAKEGTSETIVLRATVPNETAAKTLYAVWKENSPEGGTQGDAVGTQSVNEAPAAPAPEPVQPEVPAEGEVKPSDTDKTEPPKAETPESP